MVPDRASELQKGFRMKRTVVAMLAALALAGCGLEEGEVLLEDGTVLTADEALLAGIPSGASDGGTIVTTALPTPQVIPFGFNPRALPQDPVPVKPPEYRGWGSTPDDP